MKSSQDRPRWQNPFISKLAALNDVILSASRENISELKPQLEARRALFPGLIVELCAGSGGHLIELAAANPNALCIGIELRFKRLVRTAEKSKLRGIENLILIQIDANSLSEILPKQSCDRIFINFPDPWDGKARWEDKYLLSKSYLEMLHSLLKSDGSFHHKTDHQRRFFQVHSLLSEQLKDQFQISEYSEDLHRSEYNDNNILTEFERLFTSQKKPVFYLKAIKPH